MSNGSLYMRKTRWQLVVTTKREVLIPGIQLTLARPSFRIQPTPESMNKQRWSKRLMSGSYYPATQSPKINKLSLISMEVWTRRSPELQPNFFFNPSIPSERTWRNCPANDVLLLEPRLVGWVGFSQRVGNRRRQVMETL